MEKVRFNIGEWAGNRVSKHADHAYDPVMSAREFDGFMGWIEDSIANMAPPVPEGYTQYNPEKDAAEPIPNPTMDVYRLGWNSATTAVKEFLDREGRERLREIEKDLNEQLEKADETSKE